MCCISNNFILGIVVSVWTVVQTIFHIAWVLCGHYFYVCKIKPGHYVLVIIYLTYFYSHDCGDVTIDSDRIFVTNNSKKYGIQLNSNDTEDQKVYDIVQKILERAILPMESSAAWRTHLYFFAFIIFDGVWIVSAFLLFAGTCFQIRKCLSLLFYCPWLVTTASIIFLDVVSAVHFGLDILQIHSFTTWLKFIGVENYDDFSNYNSRDLSRLIPSSPTILLCVLFSRFFVIWIFNVVNFFQILNIAVLAFQDQLGAKNSGNQRNTGRRLQTKTAGDQDLNLDSSASRIRSWQLFYGATETTSTGSSSSAKSGEKDCNSNNSTSGPGKSSGNAQANDPDSTLVQRQHSVESADSYGKYVFSKDIANPSTYYRRYSDVTEDVDIRIDRNASGINSLNSQLPWAYFPAHLDRRNINRPSNISLEDYGHPRTIHNPLGNVQTASTEL